MEEMAQKKWLRKAAVPGESRPWKTVRPGFYTGLI